VKGAERYLDDLAAGAKLLEGEPGTSYFQ